MPLSFKIGVNSTVISTMLFFKFIELIACITLHLLSHFCTSDFYGFIRLGARYEITEDDALGWFNHWSNYLKIAVTFLKMCQVSGGKLPLCYLKPGTERV